MIIGIGCDIVDHQMANQLWSDNPKHLSRIFTDRELNIFSQKNNIRFLAGRFAAKEAIVKCLGTGMEDGISLKEIEILQLINGKPEIKLEGEIKKLSMKLGIAIWNVSISHTTAYSVAFVIAEN